ncbi:MAG TPA: DUF4159 domain-containing protein [Vicinamibacterales bacterium]|nr:DUF4159 domain-containing protein [Vicinamibacterales bacterium]
MRVLATRRRLLLLAFGVIALALAARVDAQFRRGGGFFGRRFFNTRIATPADFDGKWHFCRVVFNRDFRGDGADWSVDWPRADINLSIRLAELTKTDVSKAPSGEPNHLLIRLTDPELFSCPFIMMTEVGAAGLTDEEAAKLHDYLVKGGFLWADDFWGDLAWEWWEGQLRKALPAKDYPIIDLAPPHPIYSTQFDVKKTPQISSIGFWEQSGGETSERGAESAHVDTRAAIDSHGRIMVLMTHNTDFGDAFEREADDPQYFMKFSVPGYQFGINALLYSMTH